MTRKKWNPEIEIIYKNTLSHEEQLKRVDKINDIFVDIATRYHVERIKQKEGSKPND